MSVTQNLAFQRLIFLFETKENIYKKFAMVLGTMFLSKAKHGFGLKWILKKFKVSVKINREKFFRYFSMRPLTESIFRFFF